MYPFDYIMNQDVSCRDKLALPEALPLAETLCEQLQSNHTETGTITLDTIEEALMDVTGAIAIVFFFSTFVIIWGGFILTRHKERTMMIEKGLKAEEIKSLYSRGTWRAHPLTSLKWGIIILAIGVAALFGMYLHANFLVEEGVIPGLMATFGGAGLIIFYFIARRKPSVDL